MAEVILRNIKKIYPHSETKQKKKGEAEKKTNLLVTAEGVVAVQNFNLAQHLGFALGSGVGYMASVLLVVEGQRKLSRRSVPAAFRGLPIMLIYIGILALAVYGFTGHSLAN